MKRLFIGIGIDPGDELLYLISSVKTSLAKERIRWVDPSAIHLTLSFLGDTEEERIKILKELLRQKCSGFGELDFELNGTGIFKNYKDPRVIWVGIKSVERLTSLYNIINEGLKSYDFKTEERQFSPHLTLGRIKNISDIENLKSVLERFNDYMIQKVHISHVILFESILTQSGPIYKSLGSYQLK